MKSFIRTHLTSYRTIVFFLLAVLVNGMASFLHSQDLDIMKKKKVAICYFGLTRSLKEVYLSHFEYLFNSLEENNVDYDIFMHTWALKGKQRFWYAESDIPLDYDQYHLLNPNYYRIDNQDAFTESLDMSKYFYEDVWLAKGNCGEGEWDRFLVLNHLCALESQKRVIDMVLSSNNHYDFIMYVRPDVLFKNPLNVNEILQLKNEEIIFPEGNDFEGYNDRFAILTFASAPIYGKRIEHIADFRCNNGRIVSEKYLKYIVDKNHLNVRRIHIEFDIVRPSS